MCQCKIENYYSEKCKNSGSCQLDNIYVIIKAKEETEHCRCVVILY